MKIIIGIIAGLLITIFEQNGGYAANVTAPRNETDIVEYVLLNEDNPCARKCVKNATPMTCRYQFDIEWYDTLSKACYDCPLVESDCFREDCIPADGHKRPVVVINRKMPGPSIEVCLGDEVIIDVTNQLGSESTTIHWHGHHQKESPYMDGVPLITQCPISAGSTFRYTFNVKNAGTHFWHSHSGMQRGNGAFGSFIVRLPEEDNPHAALYDYELSQHVISIMDWDVKEGMDKFVSHHHNTGDNKPTTLLINGLGRTKNFSFDNGTETSFRTPAARFVVEKGHNYRFRVINAGFLNCPIEVSVDNHTITAISSDGSDFKAVEVESIVTYAGERFDFVLNASQDVGVYWMRFSGLMDCDERFKGAYQVAVLSYKGASEEYPSTEPTYENSHRDGMQLNSLNKGTEVNGSDSVVAPQLQAVAEWDNSLKEKADFQYYVSYDFYKIDNPHYHKFPLYGFNNVTDRNNQLLTPQFNHISMKLFPFPLLSQRDQINQKLICNETTVENCETDYCECTHIVNIPLNSVVELVLIDKGYAFDANHPFHLHGHSFRVVAMERINSSVDVSEVVRRDQLGLINRNLVDAPIKDTVTVPDGGYTILRFEATNPGYWLFHCHIEFHVEVGMALVFKMGEDSEMPPVPRGFPKCGDFVPNAEECDEDSSSSSTLTSLIRRILPDYCPSGNDSSNVKFDSFVLLLLVVVSFIFSNNILF